MLVALGALLTLFTVIEKSLKEVAVPSLTVTLKLTLVLAVTAPALIVIDSPELKELLLKLKTLLLILLI